MNELYEALHGQVTVLQDVHGSLQSFRNSLRGAGLHGPADIVDGQLRRIHSSLATVMKLLDVLVVQKKAA